MRSRKRAGAPLFAIAICRGGLMFHLVLLNPEIPANTGNIIRLSANVGARLHLAGRLGFAMDDKRLRRAGLDYREYAEVQTHADLDAALAAAGDGRQFAVCGGGDTRYDAPDYRPGDIFVFGCESSGLPPQTLARFAPPQRLFIPMRPGNRSLNLSNAAAVVAMEVWRKMQFHGAVKKSPA